MSSVTGLIQKLIKLTILDCISSNCSKWTATSATTWELCNSGYILNLGVWDPQNSSSNPAQSSSTNSSSSQNSTILSEEASKISQDLSIAIKVIVGLIALIVALTSLFNVSNMASLWMLINQLQLFFV